MSAKRELDRRLNPFSVQLSTYRGTLSRHLIPGTYRENIECFAASFRVFSRGAGSALNRARSVWLRPPESTLHCALRLELFNWILHFIPPVNGVRRRTD